jgi:hypothetical protein
MHPLIQQRADDIAQLCRRYRVRQLEVFGSAARGDDFDPDRSDADFLVEFEPNAIPGVDAFFALKEGLERTLGREVDLVDRKAIEQSRNYIRRHHILRSAKAIYVA